MIGIARCSNIPIGQSGQILSSHYKDQWVDYYNARSYPMQFGKVDAKSTLTFKAVGQALSPAK